MKRRNEFQPVPRRIALFLGTATLLVSLLAGGGAWAFSAPAISRSADRNLDLLTNTSAQLSLADPRIGCLENLCSKDTLYVTTDQHGLVNLELVIELPAGLVVDLPSIYADPFTNKDPNLLHAYWQAQGGDSILVDMAWGPTYSTGNPSNRIASLALRNAGAVTGMYTISCTRSLWFDSIGVPHVNELNLGTTSINVDCRAPVISSVGVNGNGAVQSCPSIANRFSATFDRGPAPGDAPLQTAWVTFFPSNETFVIFNSVPPSNPYSVTFPDTARCADFLNALGDTCSILTLHLEDAECNTAQTLLANLCDHPLPVELVTFEAYPVAEGVRLYFVFASETNSDHFENLAQHGPRSAILFTCDDPFAR